MSPSRLSLLALLAIALPLHAQTSALSTAELSEQAQQHRSPEWAQVEQHLPNPETATPTELETAADVLRIRRFDYDALAFYRSAIDRGGEPAHLLNRIGMLELGLRQPRIARMYFLRATTLQPKNPQYWNNAAAAEFLAVNLPGALRLYKKAIQIQKKNAIFHANLATVYFEMKDYESTRKQVDLALHYDPDLYRRQDGSGSEARVVTSTDRGRFCFELARSAARRHDDPSVILWLTKSADANFDFQSGLDAESALAAYRKDPRVLLLIQNARSLHNHRVVATAAIPPLTEPAPPQ